MSIQFPTVLRPLLGKLIWRKDPSKKVIYLTFDDGPVPEVTPLVLDILEKYKIKATFFCVGENVQKHPKLYADVLQRGHKTGNHTFNHLRGFSVKAEHYIENTEKAAKLIDSKLFRPPHGQISPKQRKLLEQSYEIVMWDVLTYDYDRNLSPERVLHNVKKYARNGSIIVFHDSIKAQKNVLTVLPLAIEFLINEGYCFDLL